MNNQLKVSVGQCSDKGRKESNQDFHGCYIPNQSLLSLKGVAFAMADGISSSRVSHIASETAVKSFLDDYFCTSDAWSVQNSVYRVVSATNAWLHTQNQNSEFRYDKDKGYVSTLSALVIKSNTAHVFHAGDTRVYRLRAKALEQLTKDHRLWVSQETSYLSRAMGVEPQLELDHLAMTVDAGDVFILATDGVYEFADTQFIIQKIMAGIENQTADLDAVARQIVNEAYEQGSGDNLSVQIIAVEQVPGQDASVLQQKVEELPCPPILEPRASFDGYTIVREVHATSRSHVYLAVDQTSKEQVILKTPSIDLGSDPQYLERFLMEEWVARRVNSAHVIKAGLQARKRNYLYTVTEYIDGQTLAQWLIDNPKPDLATVRGIIEQVAKGLQALHRMEILHQDIKPDNIMIDSTGTLKVIDFGSARVAGIVEASVSAEQSTILGTALYAAPEYFLGEIGSQRSDLYSLGVLIYHLLSGRFPYGTDVSKARTAAAQRRLSYRTVLDDERDVPAWIDETIKKAVHPNPYKRYQELSELLADLRRPNKAFVNKTRPPLIERSPVQFWQGVSACLAAVVVFLLVNS